MDVGLGLMWFVAFLFSTTVHEAMHAWVAYRGGDPTAYHGGQVSLSPIPHIKREPIGMLVVPLLTAFTAGWAMGWASAPYDPYWAARHPRRAALMAAAGPAGNLAIALAAFAILKVGLATGWFLPADRATYETLVIGTSGPNGITTLLSMLVMLNVLLGIFNLLPLPPLDGAAVASIFLPSSDSRACQRVHVERDDVAARIAGGVAGVSCFCRPAVLDGSTITAPGAQLQLIGLL